MKDLSDMWFDAAVLCIGAGVALIVAILTMSYFVKKTEFTQYTTNSVEVLQFRTNEIIIPVITMQTNYYYVDVGIPKPITIMMTNSYFTNYNKKFNAN